MPDAYQVFCLGTVSSRLSKHLLHPTINELFAELLFGSCSHTRQPGIEIGIEDLGRKLCRSF